MRASTNETIAQMITVKVVVLSMTTILLRIIDQNEASSRY
ncbi:hypothetical protein SDC9_180304 [bioreactor metagenome]|uniref:Uncharacterized protein n=1 Tax=bioreactor metagenome TaxID=1076179 RepID=A0A645HAK1_9ZZZZ